MVYDAAQTARNAEADQVNDPGYCLQQCRIWAGINAMYADASTAWRNTNDRHPGDRTIPRGAMAYWTGGSQGYGHIACSLGGPPGNPNIRSTDAGGSGRVATRSLSWFDANWPSLNYAGWAWDINEVTIPHGDPTPPTPPEEDDVPKFSRMKITKPVKVKGGQYTSLAWDTVSAGDAGKEGQAYMLLGQSPFTATLSLRVTATGTGSIWTRMIERQTNSKGEWEDSEVYPGLEHQVTSGDTWITDTRTQRVTDKTRLVCQVQVPEDGTVVSGDWSVLYF